MTQATNIEHLCLMISSNVASHSFALISEYGYLDRLDKIVRDGGYAAPGTCEEIQLRKAAGRLRELADRVESTRTELLKNAPYLKIV